MKEKELVGEGKKPFFLKRSEVKKQLLVNQFEGMKKRQVDKVIERKEKEDCGQGEERVADGEEGISRLTKIHQVRRHKRRCLILVWLFFMKVLPSMTLSMPSGDTYHLHLIS